jgi:H+/Cl- antiporter ClcA
MAGGQPSSPKFVPVFSSYFFAKVCVAGIFFGLCSLLLIETLRLFERVSLRTRIWSPLKGVLGGSVLIILSFLFSSRYLGLGLNAIKAALEGGTVLGIAFILKILFTSITLSFGGSGGIITPIFFFGASAGHVFADVLGFNVTIFSAIGMVALLAGAANTPISASIMAIELFGAEVGPFAAIACVVSFLMTGHRSVYPSQALSLTKSSSLTVAHGKEMKNIGEIEYKPRQKSVSEIIRRSVNKMLGK